MMDQTIYRMINKRKIQLYPGELNLDGRKCQMFCTKDAKEQMGRATLIAATLQTPERATVKKLTAFGGDV